MQNADPIDLSIRKRSEVECRTNQVHAIPWESKPRNWSDKWNRQVLHLFPGTLICLYGLKAYFNTSYCFLQFACPIVMAWIPGDARDWAKGRALRRTWLRPVWACRRSSCIIEVSYFESERGLHAIVLYIFWYPASPMRFSSPPKKPPPSPSRGASWLIPRYGPDHDKIPVRFRWV